MSLTSKSFVDLSLQGKVFPDQIDDFVDIWHEENTGLKLREFLGLTDDEYSLRVEKPNSLQYILNARKNSESISDYLEQCKISQLADPDDCAEDIDELIILLKEIERIVG